MNALKKHESAAILIGLLVLLVAVIEPLACVLFLIGITLGFSVTTIK